MMSTDRCVICDSKKMGIYRAKMAPFLADRIWGRTSFDVSLKLCKNCTILFFDPRLSQDEVERLYKDYRGDEYQKERSRFEKGYTKEFNDAVGNDPAEISTRKRNLASILERNVDLTRINSVLDHGGDRGQFIVDELSGKDLYVFEISGVPPLEGIKSISERKELSHMRFDLIMSCHVLEHVSYPLALLQDVLRSSHSGTLVYLEVPFDSPMMAREGEGLIIRMQRKAFRYPSLMNQYFKIGKNQLTMHEHINYYNTRSLSELVKRCGLDIVEMTTPTIEGFAGRSVVISCLAKVP